MDRTYWDFFTGLGFLGSVFLFFSVLLALQLGGLSKETLRSLRVVRWGFALSFVLVSVISWRYVSPVPLGLASLVAVCLLFAARRTGEGVGWLLASVDGEIDGVDVAHLWL